VTGKLRKGPWKLLSKYRRRCTHCGRPITPGTLVLYWPPVDDPSLPAIVHHASHHDQNYVEGLPEPRGRR